MLKSMPPMKTTPGTALVAPKTGTTSSLDQTTSPVPASRAPRAARPRGAADSAAGQAVALPVRLDLARELVPAVAVQHVVGAVLAADADDVAILAVDGGGEEIGRGAEGKVIVVDLARSPSPGGRAVVGQAQRFRGMVAVELADLVVLVRDAGGARVDVEVPAEVAVVGGDGVEASLARLVVVYVHTQKHQVLLG